MFVFSLTAKKQALQCFVLRNSPILALLSALLLLSHQVELLQVVSEDGVFDGHEDEADVFCVRGAGEVRVHLLVLVRVLILVHFQDEFLSRFRILLRSCNSVVIFQHLLSFL